MMRHQVSKLWASFLMILISAGFALTQNPTGSIHGTARDPHNAVVPNATITVTYKATNAMRKLTTSSDGAYTVENLLPGEYEVKVEAEGFGTQVVTATVVTGNTTTGDFSLQVGSISDVVAVTAEATLVNTTDSPVGGVINRERVEGLPLNGRSFLSMAALEPGVSVNYAANSGSGNPNNFFQVSVDGAPQSMTLISVDGARVNDRITGGTSQNFSAETVQEFQISTLAFDLSAGTVSAGAVNVVTRTGSNEFHGGAFLFFRDHNMAAFPGFKRPTDPSQLSVFCVDPASAACARVQDPFFVRKQFGATLGGPIQKNKLFFFGNYERNDQVGANALTFTDPLLAGFNHIAKQPLKGHLFSVRLDDKLNQKHTAFLRSGADSNNSVSGGNTLESNWVASSNFSYQTQMGITSVLKPTLVNDFRFSYSYFRNHLAPPTQDQCESISGNPAFCFGLNGVRITFFGGLITGNSINVPQDRHPRTFQWTDNVNWIKGAHRVRFGGNWEHSYSHGTWNQNYKGSFSVFSPSTLQTLNPEMYNALPASLKTGGLGATMVDLLKLPVNGTLQMGIGDPSSPPPYNRDQILANNAIRFYLQDAWTIRSGLTLNYGLGWSFEDNILYHDIDLPAYLAPLLGADDIGKKIGQRYKNFDPALGFAWALGRTQKTVIRSSISLHHISPNVGFYNLDQRILFGPAGNGLASFTGSGLANPKAGQAGQPALLNFPTPANFTAQDMIDNLSLFRSGLIASNPYNGTDLSVRGVNVTKSVQGGQLLDAIYDNNSARMPYTIQFNAGVQQEVMSNLSVGADFVMRRGVGFGAFELFFPDLNLWNRYTTYTLNATSGVATPVRNPVIPACTGNQGADPNAQCSLGPIQYGLPGILSRYMALQVKVDRRFSNGFQIGGSYARSRYVSFVSISNNNNLHEGFGPVAANPHHRFTMSGLWDAPKYAGSHWLLRGALNGWQVSTIMQMQTGPQPSVTLGTLDVDGDGTFVYRLPGTGVGSFGNGLNAADIRRLVDQYNASVPAAANVALRDIPKGPQRDAAGAALPYVVLPDKFASGDSFLTHDLRVTRTISINERVKFLLIGEGFNIFNIANLTGFSGTLNAYGRPATTGGTPTLPASGLTFGQPTGRLSPVFGSGGPRAFQLAARLSF
jgi:hypothetical protein